MKKNISAAFFWIVLLSVIAKENVNTQLNLNDALKSGRVKCIITGNEKSTHYLQPVIVQLENTDKNSITISINNGDLFIPQDSVYQNIIVTQDALFVLQPKEKKTMPVSGMCIEQFDKAGLGTTHYAYAANKNDSLKMLSAFLQKNKLQSSCAQYAMWCLANHTNINSVYSSDSTEENKLKSFLAQLTGKTFSVSDKNYKNYYFAPPKEKVSGKFNFNFSNLADIQIALFNKNGILVRELYNEKNVQPGAHNFQYAFDASVYTEDIYYVKFIADNEVFINREWDVKAIRDKFKQKIQQKLDGN